MFANVENSSISIGWLGDLYIDFSWQGAILGAFVLGLGIGWIQRALAAYRGAPLLVNLAIATAAMLPFTVFERPLVKVIGGGLIVFGAAIVIQWIVALLVRRTASRRPRARAQSLAGNRPL